METIKEFIIRITENAGKMAIDFLGKSKISEKGFKDIVTEADKEIDYYLSEKIKERFPNHSIYAEESGDDKKESDFVWYIDPIDGTHNFAHKDPNFCVSVALAEKGVIKYAAVYIPMLNELYYAEKGKGAELNGKKIEVSKIDKLENAMVHIGIMQQSNMLDKTIQVFRHLTMFSQKTRDYGFAAGELCYLASGRADGYIRYNQHVWDIAAGSLILEEAKGIISDLNGNPLKFDKESAKKKYNVIASNGLLHKTLINTIKTI
ncbi:MAG: inositol monophosphatase [Candidatus Woesearchaeota archaeon]